MLLLALPGEGGRAVAVQASPAVMIGLFLHYAFLRLPIAVSALVGWAVSVLAVAWAPMVIGGSEFLRSCLYLSFANVFGMVLCRLLESRERELFHQRRRTEAARLEARERQAAAEEADRQKTRLIAAVSHDLRQPMAAAVAHLDVARSRLQADDLERAREPAERAEAALTMLGTTLDHLLTAARYDSGTEALDIRPLELRPLLRDLYGGYVGEADKRGVELRVRPPRSPVVLQTDARSIQRVLSNLVANAVKFTHSDDTRAGRVLIAARMRGDRCRIDVFDTGIGVAPEAFEEIWKPYVQLNNVERDRERGLGLGLFLVGRIIEQLPDHTVTMASVPGRGSRFTVTVPAVTVDAYVPMAPAVPEAMPLPDLSPLRGAYVLLIEDDRDARTAVARLMAEWGVRVTAGVSLSEVLEKEADSDRTVDAIVCDYRLAGGANGIAAIAELRRQLGYSPAAVLITGEPDIEPLRVRAGPDTTVLHKPFRSEALMRPLLRAVAATRELERG
ncbi:MAG: ATP-binding protein [Burkholderiales bacterium]